MSAKMKILLKAATLSKGSHNHIQDEPMSFVILSLRRKKKKKNLTKMQQLRSAIESLTKIYVIAAMAPEPVSVR